MKVITDIAGWVHRFIRFLVSLAASMAPSQGEASLFLQPGMTMRDVTIPQYSESLESNGILRVVVIQVGNDGLIEAERLSVELAQNGSDRGVLRAHTAVLERNFDGIRTNGGTELRMGGVELKTEGMTCDLKALEFVSSGGFQLKCHSGSSGNVGTGQPVSQQSPEWDPMAGEIGRGKGPIVYPRSPHDPFWFDGSLSRRLDFCGGDVESNLMRGQSIGLLSKGPGRFQIKDGAYSASNGVLMRFPLGMIACGDRVDMLWGKYDPFQPPQRSKVMPSDLRRFHAVGGCHAIITGRRGKVHVMVCEEVKYSGRTGLVSLKGGYPRIESAEGGVIASSENQFIRINAEGRLILGPGHWLSDFAL